MIANGWGFLFGTWLRARLGVGRDETGGPRVPGPAVPDPALREIVLFPGLVCPNGFAHREVTAFVQRARLVQMQSELNFHDFQRAESLQERVQCVPVLE